MLKNAFVLSRLSRVMRYGRDLHGNRDHSPLFALRALQRIPTGDGTPHIQCRQSFVAGHGWLSGSQGVDTTIRLNDFTIGRLADSTKARIISHFERFVAFEARIELNIC